MSRNKWEEIHRSATTPNDRPKWEWGYGLAGEPESVEMVRQRFGPHAAAAAKELTRQRRRKVEKTLEKNQQAISVVRDSAPRGVLASDAERERTIERLHTARLEGRLSVEGYEWRVAAALKATHRPELERVTADLPEQTVERKPERPVERLDKRRLVKAVLLAAGIYITGLMIVTWLGVFSSPVTFDRPAAVNHRMLERNLRAIEQAQPLPLPPVRCMK